MSKTSIFLPLSCEYDPEEGTFKETFGASDIEILNVMRKVHERIRENAELRSSDLFMELLQSKECSSEFVLMMASVGFKRVYEESAPGLDLVYYAERELKDKNDGDDA